MHIVPVPPEPSYFSVRSYLGHRQTLTGYYRPEDTIVHDSPRTLISVAGRSARLRAGLRSRVILSCLIEVALKRFGLVILLER